MRDATPKQVKARDTMDHDLRCRSGAGLRRAEQGPGCGMRPRSRSRPATRSIMICDAGSERALRRAEQGPACGNGTPKQVVPATRWIMICDAGSERALRTAEQGPAC